MRGQSYMVASYLYKFHGPNAILSEPTYIGRPGDLPFLSEEEAMEMVEELERDFFAVVED